MGFLWSLVIAIVGLIGALMAWRFFTLRSRGFAVVVRALPCKEGRHWRHGVLIYSPRQARIFKLRSIRPEPDYSFTRLHTRIIGRRQIKDSERHVLGEGIHIVEVENNTRKLELALDSRADTALVAWLESGPNERRVRYRALR